MFVWASLFLLYLTFFSHFSFASLDTQIQTQLFQYATDSNPTFYFKGKSILESDSFLIQVHTYDESGSKGAWSFDLDPIRYTLSLSDDKKDFLWLGREQPLNLTREHPVEPFTALGTLWPQNQLEALNPRVSGWIGLGVVKTLSENFKFNFAYSPLFLPTFGPSLGFTERGEINPSRFARLPPDQAIIGGVHLPIRYQLKVGQLSELLLQHQVFTSLSTDTSFMNADVFAYTAPKPDPVPLTSGRVDVRSPSYVNAQAQIQVQFPREYWAGTRFYFKEIFLKPALEWVQNLKDTSLHTVSLTHYFNSPLVNPYQINKVGSGAFGLLTHLQTANESARYSDLLVFLKIPLSITENLSLMSYIQATLLASKQGFYLSEEFEYAFTPFLSALASVHVLSGQDGSYFGDWRQEDFYGSGLKWKF